MDPKDVPLGDVLFEFRIIGGYVRVSAIDARTNTEVTMVGDPSYGEQYLKRAALRKLRYVLSKRYRKRPGDGSILA